MKTSRALAVLWLLACGPSADAHERQAREALERDAYEAIRLHEVPGEPPGVFDFTGTRHGIPCEGTIRVSRRGRRSTAAIQARCE